LKILYNNLQAEPITISIMQNSLFLDLFPIVTQHFGSDDELENIRSTRSTSKDRLKSGKTIGTVISTSNKKSGKQSFSPIKWEPKRET
jgi:hypothetical protein